jgi:DNA-binding NarL/FixJ family response regulator
VTAVTEIGPTALGPPRTEFATTFTAMVVDDHPLVRESMVARLRSMGATDIVEAASAAEARARARSGPRDLAVLDLGLPDGNGIELVAHLRAEGWTRVVVLSAADDPYSVRAAFVAGAQGYLLKTASPVVVNDGVRQVLGGGVYADPDIASLLAAGLRSGGPNESGIADLSGREVEVLRLVADGQSNKEIGDQLGLSALTVKSHLARIARKLGTGDRAEMVALAMRAGVIR